MTKAWPPSFMILAFSKSYSFVPSLKVDRISSSLLEVVIISFFASLNFLKSNFLLMSSFSCSNFLLKSSFSFSNFRLISSYSASTFLLFSSLSSSNFLLISYYAISLFPIKNITVNFAYFTLPADRP